jgi:hypothetical protein
MVSATLGILVLLALVGGILMVSSTGSNSASSIILGGRTQQLSVGIALFLAGLVGVISLILFIGIFGKFSIFRPHTPRPTIARGNLLFLQNNQDFLNF